MTNTGKTYKSTLISSYIAIAIQAMAGSFVPLLFVQWSKEFGLSFSLLALITTIDYLIRLVVGLFAVSLSGKIGIRKCILTGHVFCAAGYLGLALFPGVFPDPYAGIIFTVLIYGVGCGFLEALLSAVVEALPTDNKQSIMSLLHSFYSWGYVLVILISTLFFYIAGVAHWRIMAVIWAMFPIVNFFFFSMVPVYEPDSPAGGNALKGIVHFLKIPVFWIMLTLMFCAGACEVNMISWASTLAEKGLNISKTAGDLAGPCAFSVFMAMSRMLYSKMGSRVSIEKMIAVCAVLCTACYITVGVSPHPLPALLGCALCGFSIGVFWPGALSLCSATLKSNAAAMFATLAIFGEIGCGLGPAVIGVVADMAGDIRRGLLVGAIFPLIILISLLIMKSDNGDGSQ